QFLGNISLGTPLGNINTTALTEIWDLLRDATEDLLRTQSYIEVGRPSFLFDTCWWTTFTHNPINPNKALPRSTKFGCDVLWSSNLAPGATPQCKKTYSPNPVNKTLIGT